MRTLLGGLLASVLFLGGMIYVHNANAAADAAATPPPVTSEDGAAVTIDPAMRLPYRVGAVCADGWASHATGRGACSWHGGVREWLVSNCTQVDIALARGHGRRLPDCTFRLDRPQPR
jgi:hypothetical protein